MTGPGGFGGGGDGGLGGGGFGGGYGGIDPGGGKRDLPNPAMAEPRERHREPRSERVTPEPTDARTVQDPVVLHERQRLAAQVEVFARVDAVVAEILPELLSGFAGRVELWRRAPGGEWAPLPVPPPGEDGR